MGRIVRATTEARQQLGEILPLDTPFTFTCNITNVCNFRCIYCAQSNRPGHLENKMMPWDVYQKCIDNLSRFPRRLKVLLLAGLGEPLAHPEVARMVAYAKEKNVAETCRIITNASLLTHDLSDQLIDAGLDSLKISIQGLNDRVYKKMCGTSIPLSRILDNITYFYQNKKDTVVNVKIVADAFESPEDETRFYEMFNNISDIMNIEHISPYQELVDYSKIIGEGYVTQSGCNEKLNRICYMPFYMFGMYPDGLVIPCCYASFETYKKMAVGNINDVDLVEFWNSKEMNEFRLTLLRDKREQLPVCATCTEFQFAGNPEDFLDDYVDQLIPKYETMLKP